MSLPTDLKHYRADRLGAFRLISEDAAGVALLCIFALLLIFAPYIN